MKKTLRRIAIGLPLFLLAYLLLAASWAAVSIDEILAREPVATLSMPLSARQGAMLLAIEDPTFYSHAGLSLADGQGATTLTSSLARDVFLFRTELGGIKGAMQSLYRAVFACCRKVDLGRDVMALVLDAQMPKDHQLALFVDQVYMGRHQGLQLRGLAPASQALFGKPLPALNEAEFSGLIGMIKSPNEFHPQRHPAAFLQRQARVAAVAAGRCMPAGWFDTDYAGCKP